MAKAAKDASKGAAEIEKFLKALEHPRKAELEAIRQIILGADPRIQEGIKWNTTSFYFKDWFATVGVRPDKDVVQLVLHRGAKVKDDSGAMKIDDPIGMLVWPAKDRALATFSDMNSVRKSETNLRAIVKEWMSQL